MFSHLIEPKWTVGPRWRSSNEITLLQYEKISVAVSLQFSHSFPCCCFPTCLQSPSAAPVNLLNMTGRQPSPVVSLWVTASPLCAALCVAVYRTQHSLEVDVIKRRRLVRTRGQDFIFHFFLWSAAVPESLGVPPGVTHSAFTTQLSYLPNTTVYNSNRPVSKLNPASLILFHMKF